MFLSSGDTRGRTKIVVRFWHQTQPSQQGWPGSVRGRPPPRLTSSCPQSSVITLVSSYVKVQVNVAKEAFLLLYVVIKPLCPETVQSNQVNGDRTARKTLQVLQVGHFHVR